MRLRKWPAAGTALDLDDIIAAVREELESVKLVIEKMEALIAKSPKKPGHRPAGIVEVAKPRAKKRQRTSKGTKDEMS